MNHIEVRFDRRPLYIVVKEKLRQLVDNEVFRPGSKLPRETELAQMMNVSRATLREAISIAKQEGWITQIHGVGTFISRGSAVEKGLEILESLDSFSKRRGWTCETIDINYDTRQLGEKIAGLLHLHPDDEMLVVSRVKQINGVRAAYIEDFIPKKFISMEELQKDFTGSVLDLLKKRSKPKIDYAWTNIICEATDEILSNALHVGGCSSVLVAEEILYDTDGIPIEYSINYMLSTFFNFHIIRTFPP